MKFEAGAIDPREVQRGLCVMLLDPGYAELVRGEAALPELGAAARAMLRTIDPRALGLDRFRRTRALQVILEEMPVSAAIVGVAAAERFFSSPALRAAIFGRGSMVLAFGGWLGDTAGGVGRLEFAMARARRGARAMHEGRGEGGGAMLRCSPKIAPLVAPAGTLAWYQRALARLGPTPLVTLAAQTRPWPQRPPSRGEEFLLVEAGAEGAVALGTGSAALVRLLVACAEPRGRAAAAASAVALGAEAEEVEGLIDSLVEEGLLVVCVGLGGGGDGSLAGAAPPP
jgi:hypothetical protein